MPLQHAYTQTVADGTATSVVRPSDWNSAHVWTQQISGNTLGASTASGTNIVYQGGNNVTLSVNQGANAATVVFSAAAGGAGDGVNVVAMATNTVGGGGTAGATQTATTGTVYLQAGNNMTLSQNGNSIVFSGLDAAWSLAGANTVGTNSSNLSANSFYFSGGNNITLSGNSNTIVISGKNTPDQITIGGNTAGVGAAISTGTFFLAGGSNVTISQNANSLSFHGAVGQGTTFGGTNVSASMTVNTAGVALSLSAPNPGGGAANTISFYEPTPIVGTAGGVAVSLGQNSIYFVPVKPLENVSMTVINMFASNAIGSSAAASYARSMTLTYGMYSLGTGTNNTNIYTMGSSTLNIFMSGNSSNASCGLTIQGAGSTYTNTVASSSGMTQWASNKILQLPFATSLAVGGEYYFAIAQSTTSPTGANAGFTMSNIVIPALTNASWGRMNPQNSATQLIVSSASVIPNYAGFIFSTTTGAFPATIALSQRAGFSSNARMYIQMDA